MDYAGWREAYDETFEAAPTVRDIVFLAIGAASMCWESPESAGEFDSRRASVLGESVLAELRLRGQSDE